MNFRVNQLVSKNLRNVNTDRMLKDSILANAPEAWDNLTEIKGIGESTQKALKEAGITTREGLKNTEEEVIKKIISNPLSQKAILNFINS